MMIKTLYIAFDDEEFESEQACRDHEEKFIHFIEEICEIFSFFDKNMNKYTISQDDINQAMNELDDAFCECEYIHITEVPSDTLLKFWNDYTGNVLPPKEVGWYKYDWDNLKWVRT